MKYSGIVRTFIPNRRFGFLMLDDGRDVFFHQNDFHGTPILGQRVEFELGPAVSFGKPPQAANIQPVEILTVSTTVSSEVKP
jgi:cold shock CspA family protein